MPTIVGVSVLMFVWWLGGFIVASNPDTESFADFAPVPTLTRLWEILASGYVVEMTWPSLYRVGVGLIWACAI